MPEVICPKCNSITTVGRKVINYLLAQQAHKATIECEYCKEHIQFEVIPTIEIGKVEVVEKEVENDNDTWEINKWLDKITKG